MRGTTTALLLAVTLVTVTACGDDDDSSPAVTDAVASTDAAPPSDAPTDGTESGDDGAGTADIVIASFSFGEPLTVPVGTTVTVRNNDSMAHTFTADDGSFDAGTLDVLDTFEISFDEPGTYAFHCDIHPSMTGTITVTP
jgi:plastocyanin